MTDVLTGPPKEYFYYARPKIRLDNAAGRMEKTRNTHPLTFSPEEKRLHAFGNTNTISADLATFPHITSLLNIGRNEKRFFRIAGGQQAI